MGRKRAGMGRKRRKRRQMVVPRLSKAPTDMGLHH